MASEAALTMLLKVKDEASKSLKCIGKLVGGVGKAAVGLGVAGAAGVAALGAGALALAKDAAELEPVKRTFDNLAKSIGSDSVEALDLLRESTRGMVADADLMQAGNKFMAMGLADSAEQAAQLAEVATQLGMAMGEDATASMENFALMMANQSIPRLDSFGISSGKVRERIEELMEANSEMSRETAFNMAVMEQAAVTMEKVGEQSGGTAATMATLQATFANLKQGIGEALIPVLNMVLEPLAALAKEHGPAIVEWFQTNIPKAIQVVSDWFTGTLKPALETAWQYITENIVPIFRAVAEWLETNIPKAIEAARQWWEETLVPAMKTVWAYIAENIIPVLEDVIDWLKEKVPEAIKAASRWWEETLVPAMKKVWEFIGENLEPILMGLKVALAVFVIPAFVAWAIAAGTAAAATVAALAPVLIPLALIVAAVALLKTAWDKDWGGIKTTLTQFWEEKLLPAFEAMKAWLAEKIPEAIETIKKWWEEKMIPALKKVWEFIDENILPIFETVKDWLDTHVPQAIETLRFWWEEKLLPAIGRVWDFLEEYIVPIFETLADITIIAVQLAIQKLRDLWEETLLPALRTVWEFIQDNIVPIFQAVWDKLTAVYELIRDKVLGNVGALTEKLSPLKTAFDAIKNAAGWVLDKLREFKDFLLGLIDVDLPEWLKPGSPPPLADSLTAIGGAAASATEMIEKFSTAVAQMPPNIGFITPFGQGTAGEIEPFNMGAGGEALTPEELANKRAAAGAAGTPVGPVAGQAETGGFGPPAPEGATPEPSGVGSTPSGGGRVDVHLFIQAIEVGTHASTTVRVSEDMAMNMFVWAESKSV